MTPAERRKAFNKARKEQLSKLVPYKSAVWEELLRLLEIAEESVQAVLQAASTDWQQWHYAKIQGQLNQAFIDLGDRSAEQIAKYSPEVFVAGVDLIDKPLASAGIKVTGLSPLLNHPTLTAITNFQTERIKSIATGMFEGVKKELSLVTIGAQDFYKARDNISAMLVEPSYYDAKRLINTEMSRLYSTATNARLLQSSAAVPGLKKEWRTGRRKEHRLHHLALRGTRKPVDEKFKVGQIEMMHPHDPAGGAAETIYCSCYVVPVMDNWDVDEKLALKTDVSLVA